MTRIKHDEDEIVTLNRIDIDNPKNCASLANAHENTIILVYNVSNNKGIVYSVRGPRIHVLLPLT